ncbi:MAG TPA: isoleucine--tRNA ligase [Actinomycetaceae bacterium]|nr:isoleucine--tRNA ligase [Actinomycetaceae bacterium]
MTENRQYPLHRDGELTASPDFPAFENAVLAYWQADGTFQASIDQRDAGPDGSNEFVFYDGPPFANGLPHYGHLLTGYVKDVVGRFQTQLGHRVERRFGWDTHGLPAELEAQRILGITEKSEIEELGIEEFNEACRDSVMTYADVWEEYVNRQARWVDFENDYKTLDTPYMESVIWAFKTLYDKGLAYEGYRVLPYCWNDETPLSNHELKMDDDVYAERTDQSVTVGLRLIAPGRPEIDGALALIWTTTPWTLPSNLAIAVGPELPYVLARPTKGPLAGDRIVIAEALVAAYAKELGKAPEVLARFTGSELAGLRYHPIFRYFTARREDEAPGPNAFQLITADFVSVEDGTGLVHLAPAFGEDDMIVCQAAGIGTVVPVDEGGKFTSEVPDYARLQVFEANRHIVADLRDSTGPLAETAEGNRAVLVRQSSYAHSYPHCWRCGSPLIYKAVTSWFVRVSQFRDRMGELNQQITWVPEHIKDGVFGNWLAGARDWSISRNRYWGTPIPIWVSDDPAHPRTDCYGSLAELERDFGRLPRNRKGEVDLHRPYIDELTRPNPDDPTGRSTMRRISDILDVWFDSGSMPFAQVHYPFENEDWFEHHYPGDFIVEYIGQTRGWFYTLHVLATALFDRPAFLSCISHGIVLGDDGRKASKKLRNYPDPMEMYGKYGSDAVRWSLMSSPVLRGGNLVVSEESIRDSVRHVLLPLWNSWYFLALYAGTVDGGKGYIAQPLDFSAPDVLAGLDIMDRYIVSRTAVLADHVREAFEAYDIPDGSRLVRDHLDVLTNWYVRTQRDRFWDEDRRAFDTLATVIEILTQVLAPLAPLVAEEVWRGLTGGRSVHLTDWPRLPASAIDAELVTAMDEVRAVVSAAHALRKANRLRVRQPLRELRIVSDDPGALAPFTGLIASEVNVKEVTLADVATSGLEVTSELTINPRELPADIRRYTSQLFKAQKSGAWEELGDGVCFDVRIDGVPIVLTDGQYTLTTVVNAEEGSAAEVLDSGAFVVLDTTLDPELEAEGYTRDLVRIVQDARKEAGLHVSDRIALGVTLPENRLEAARSYADMLQRETLTVDLVLDAGDVTEPSITRLEAVETHVR